MVLQCFLQVGRSHMTASMPLLGMATAVVSVTGAAYGAREYKKLDIAHLYALKIGIIIETVHCNRDVHLRTGHHPCFYDIS